MTEQLFDAALGELSVVARGQPCLLVGDFNVEPTKIPCLAKGISAGLWVDFEEAWALAAGLRPASPPVSGPGVLLVVIAGISWLVALLRLLLYLLVRFWAIGGLLPILLFAPYLIIVGGLVLLLRLCSVHHFGPLLGCLLLIRVGVPSLLRFEGFGRFMMSVFSSFLAKMLCAWMSPLILVMFPVCGLSGLVLLNLHLLMPLPSRGLVLGRGRASFRVVKLGGHRIRKARGYAADAHDAADVFLYRDSSIAPLLDMRRRLKAVMELVDAMIRYGVSLSRSIELSAQWDKILSIGPLFPVTLDDFQVLVGVGLGDFYHGVCGIHRRLCDFIHSIVVHRRDEAIRSWRNWIREDPLVHPYKWLGSDLVPPAPFLQCEPHLSPGGSGVLSDPSRIDEEFRKAWLPYFCRSGQRETSLDEFSFEVDGWLPILPEIQLPRLTGQMLADVVLRKAVSSGSLDGWGWRELEVLPVSWYGGLARILTKDEDTGVWPDGLLDAYIAMIPKTDGDAAHLGQRPLSVLPVVYRIWASTRMGQLGDWFKSWVPDSVFSAGGGRSSVEAWYTSSLGIEEVLAGATDSHVHLFVADVVKSFDTVDRTILDRVLSSLGLPGWFRHAYFECHAHVRMMFKLASGLGAPWTRDGGIPQGCPLSMMFIVALYLPWCRYLSAQVGVQPQLYADNLKCVSRDPDSLLTAARFTTGYVRLVGQEPAPSKCVLLLFGRLGIV